MLSAPFPPPLSTQIVGGKQDVCDIDFYPHTRQRGRYVETLIPCSQIMLVSVRFFLLLLQFQNCVLDSVIRTEFLYTSPDSP